jgi:hypothetical protein
MNFNGVFICETPYMVPLEESIFHKKFWRHKNHIGIRSFVGARSTLAKCGEWLIVSSNEIGEGKILWGLIFKKRILLFKS